MHVAKEAASAAVLPDLMVTPVRSSRRSVPFARWRKHRRHYLPPRYSVFLLTYSCYAIVYITRKCFSVVKSFFKDDLQLDAYSLGAIDSAFLGSYALFQIYLPSLSDHFGVRPVLLTAMFGASTFSVLFGTLSSQRNLVLCWFLEGACHAPVFAVLIKAIALWYPPSERSKVLGIWTTSQQVGSILATASATYLVTNFGGWRVVFWAAGAVTVLWAILLTILLPEPSVAGASENKESPSSSQPVHENDSKLEVPNEPGLASIELFAVVTKRKHGTTSSNTEFQSINSFTSITPLPSVVGASKDDPPVLTGVHIQTSDGNANSGTENCVKAALAERIGSSSDLGTSHGQQQQYPTVLTFWQVLVIPGLLPCAFAYLCVKVVRYALLFWLPFFLTTELNFNPSVAGYSSTAFDIGGILGATASGFVADRVFRGRKFLSTAVFCITTGITLFIFAHLAATSSSKPQLIAPDAGILSAGVSLAQLYNGDGTYSVEAQLLMSSPGKGLRRRLYLPFRRRPILNLSPQLPTSANLHLVLILMGIAGFFVAGPDSMLGASSAGEIIKNRSGAEHLLSTATGIVNGLGALGGLLQGYLTAYVSSEYGWPALFVLLGLTSIAAVVCMLRCVIADITNKNDLPAYSRMSVT